MPSDEQLSPHFHLSEFLHSQQAERRCLRNEPTVAQVSNLRRLAQTLEIVRSVLGDVPLLISSGFRSAALNVAVGGDANSAHLTGCAADFTAPSFGSPREICRRLDLARVDFDQLIFEGTWVHLGIPLAGTPARREVLTAVFHPGQRTTYMKGAA